MHKSMGLKTIPLAAAKRVVALAAVLATTAPGTEAAVAWVYRRWPERHR